MPKFNPDDEALTMLPPGQYEATVKRAEEQFSQKGNEMIALILTCYDTNGNAVDVFDYLIFTSAWLWKVRHFCESAGLDFKAGELTEAQCSGRNVRVNLICKKQAGYPEKNVVDDYLPRAGSGPTVKPAPDDDIPF